MRTDTIHQMQTDILERLGRLEQQAELMKTVLIVKEPGSTMAATVFEGLRKQVIAASGERMSHLTQIVQMAVATSRATSVDDLRHMVEEWIGQSGITRLNGVPNGSIVSDLFESLDGSALPADAPLRILEPAYVDSQSGRVIRLGRAEIAPAQPPAQTWDAAPAAPTVDLSMAPPPPLPGPPTEGVPSQPQGGVAE